MRVLVFPADSAGCGMYRLAWPAQYLKHLGHDVEVSYIGQRGVFQIVSPDGGKTISGFYMPPDVDVMVFQRISNPLFVNAVPALRRKGIAVVMDMDDDLGRISKKSAAYGTFHKNQVHSAQITAQVAEQCTMVTVTTPVLAKVYGRHGRVRIIDNYICGSDLEIPRQDSDLLGWAGTTNTRGDDWQVVGDSVSKLTREGFQFVAIGPEGTLKQELKLQEEPEYTGWIPIERWMEGMSRIGVGMAPLFPSNFNRAKSRLKVAQMAALGIPWVASPLPEYERFHRESGTGILGCSPAEWYDGLKRLLTEPSLRAEMGEAGRAHMQDQTIEANAWRWWEAWTDALKLQRS